jgi:hypothetical protein
MADQTEVMQQALDMLEAKRYAEAESLLRNAVHGAVEGDDYPRWITHPVNQSHQEVARDAEHEKELMAQWRRDGGKEQDGKGDARVQARETAFRIEEGSESKKP